MFATSRNPPWVIDELILALDMYLHGLARPADAGKPHG